MHNFVHHSEQQCGAARTAWLQCASPARLHEVAGVTIGVARATCVHASRTYSQMLLITCFTTKSPSDPLGAAAARKRAWRKNGNVLQTISGAASGPALPLQCLQRMTTLP